MSDTATRLRTHLLNDAGIAAIVGTKVHQAHVPQSAAPPYIWYQRSSTGGPVTLDGGVASDFEQFYDVECVSEDLDDMQSLVGLVKSRLHCHRGTFGDGTIKGAFVEDHSDDYIPRSVSDDSVAHVGAVRVQIIA